MPVLPLNCHLPTKTPHIPSSYSNEQTTKETKAINNSYIYIYISHVNVTQTVPDISPLMPMHQDPLLVWLVLTPPNLTKLPVLLFSLDLRGTLAFMAPSRTVAWDIYTTKQKGATYCSPHILDDLPGCYDKKLLTLLLKAASKYW